MLHGIDVSNWQGPSIDWGKVKKAGITFAAIKATEGITIPDGDFLYNWTEAKRHGIVRMAYHFFRPEFSGAEQAHFLHQTVHNHGLSTNGDGVMLDLESIDGQTPQRIIRECEQFVLTIRKIMHRQVVLYTGPYFWTELGDPYNKTLYECPLWVASWNVLSAPSIPNEPAPAFWQYSSSGIEPGIPGQVDLDYFLGNMSQLHTIIQHHL